MPYTYRSKKDGTTIENVPDDVDPKSDQMRLAVESARANGQKSSAWSMPSEAPSKPAPSEWTKTEYGFSVRPATTPEGAQTVQREDGALWYGPEQGNTGLAGWFTAKGRRAPAGFDTSTSGTMGAITRGAAPYMAGATLGAIAGAPEGGIGAIPGSAAGVALVGATKMIGDPTTMIINKAFGTDIQTPSEIMERAMDYAGVPVPGSPTERIIQTATEAGSGAGSSAMLGRTIAAASPFGSTAQGVGQAMAANPFQQVTSGLGAGAASQAAAEEGYGPGVQMLAGLGGGAAGARAGAPRTPVAPAVAADVATAEGFGIPVMSSDVTPPQSFGGKWLQGTAEKIPWIGTGGPRAAQQQARIEAIKSTVREFGTETLGEATEKVMSDLVNQRKSDISKYTQLKGEVFDRLDSMGSVPVDRTVAAIDKQVKRLSDLKTKEVEPVIARLKDWKESIQGQGIKNLELLRKQIGESFKAPDMASTRSIGEQSLNSIYGPLREDMGNFIKNAGDRRDYTKWQVANQRLREMNVDLEHGALKSVLKSGEATPEDVSKLLFSQKPSEVQKLYKNLPVDGKENAKMAILMKAVEMSNGMDAVSPEKFLTSVRKLAAPIGVFFEGESADQIKGLARSLQMTRQASQANVMPATGVQNLPLLIAGTKAAAGVLLGPLARLYESKPVRDILIKLPSVPKGGPEEAAMFKRLTSLLATETKDGNDEQRSEAWRQR